MTTRAARAAVAQPDEPPIAHHYVLVLVCEAVVLCLLAWLEARFR